MKRAILVVSFGTSYLDTLEKNIAAVERDMAAAFPDWEVRRAFTSGMIMRKLLERDGLEIHSVPQALEELIAQGFTRVVIQPTHMMHGQEYDKLVAQARPYRKQLAMEIGAPLLHQVEDYKCAAQATLDNLPPMGEDEALVLMGHGTEHFANSVYSQTERVFRSLGHERVWMGTVEGYPTLEDVMDAIARHPQIKKVTLAPFMLVAGDHAKNDMSGPEDSWKTRLEAAGYQVNCVLRGLGEYPGIRAGFVRHAAQAVEALTCGQGKLSGVGLGPGDPELITLKAIHTIQAADVVAIPDTGTHHHTALEIAGPWLEGKEILHCPTPMVRDKQLLDDCYTSTAGQICALLDAGKNVAFLTEGDPTVYSTYIYVHKKVQAKGYRVEIIPGVPSFCAAAARLNIPLCEAEERLLIVPASHNCDDCFELPGNKVFMKAGRAIAKLQADLDKHGLLESSSMVENCGLPGERVYPRFADWEERSGYFCLVIPKERKDENGIA